MPEGYRGVLVEKKDAAKPEPQRRLDEPEVVDLEAEEEEDELPLGALETQAEFDEMIIWGHEAMADAVSDPYARGVEEWVQLSSQVCQVSLYRISRYFTNIKFQIHSYDTEKAQ